MSYWPTRRGSHVAAPSRKGRRKARTNEQLIERFDTFLLVSGKAERTRASYLEGLKQFSRFLGRHLTTAKTEDIEAFLTHLRGRGLQPATIAVRRWMLRKFFYQFLELGAVGLSVRGPRVTLRKFPDVKSEAEIERLIEAADNPRDRALLELGYASGLRVSELANLRVEDLSIQALSLTARQGKGGNDRIAPFGRKAAAALRKYLGDRTMGFVFQPLPRPQRGGVWLDRSCHVWFGQWRERERGGNVVMRTVRLGDYELRTKRMARDAMDSFLSGNPEVGFGIAARTEIQRANRGLSSRQLFRIIVGIAKRAGIKGVHPHVLRHSCATHCLKRGMSVLGVMEMLGHTSPMATQKYLHVDFGDLKQAHTKFHPRG